jgi:hypothetical protein
MSEMNEVNETSKSRKPLFIGVGVAALVLALVGGGIAINANGTENPDVAPSVVATATASPSATATPTPQTTLDAGVPTVKATDEAVTSPIDIDASIAKADASVAKAFPASGFDIKEGVSQGFATYKELSEIANLHVARGAGDPADSAYAEQMKDRFTGSYLPTLKTQMDAQAPFPTANVDGSITVEGMKYQTSGAWTTKYKSEPAISTLGLEGVGITLLISGTREDTIITTTQQMVKIETGFKVAVVPQENGTWKVAGIGSEPLSMKVTNAQ